MLGTMEVRGRPWGGVGGIGQLLLHRRQAQGGNEAMEGRWGGVGGRRGFGHKLDASHYFLTEDIAEG